MACVGVYGSENEAEELKYSIHNIERACIFNTVAEEHVGTQ